MLLFKLYPVKGNSFKDVLGVSWGVNASHLMSLHHVFEVKRVQQRYSGYMYNSKWCRCSYFPKGCSPVKNYTGQFISLGLTLHLTRDTSCFTIPTKTYWKDDIIVCSSESFISQVFKVLRQAVQRLISQLLICCFWQLSVTHSSINMQQILQLLTLITEGGKGQRCSSPDLYGCRLLSVGGQVEVSPPSIRINLGGKTLTQKTGCHT